MDQSPEEDIDARAAALEAGRLLFARPWGFVTSIARYEQLAAPRGVEVAFAGRSNVGKSSLINAVTGRKGLARTSNTPGRTQLLNFFSAPDFGPAYPVTIVDMPGYGYAEAPKKTVDAWTNLIFDYLHGRPNLRRVFVLVDARHGLKGNDLAALKALDTAAVTYQIVLTKADKVKPLALEKLVTQTHDAIGRRPATFPEIIATSSEKGTGIDELRATIAEIGGFHPPSETP
ncbi:ribosome biogenesis GTP-binding protein YihA/YsxC [Breoghania sp.]|uniref:ribosome biogenesis GTP-binding protein YihA/YsxC n=1 Tax=Breoghania sp. TaxID=2065378 RepID=UPI002629099D|nr:ribosome biogenesis GTP-binding protein YihA/YsxC [Breoghania sp.]MDJ0930009.1 ribosome biogenesis GTP-binding protein YihA/YsxC [Breoghania sp.]